MAENDKGVKGGEGEARKLDEVPEGEAVYIVDGEPLAPDGKPATPAAAKAKE